MSISTPVALFVFNRPALTERVFAQVAAARPRTLFIAADGPRGPEDEALCAKTRQIVSRVDWPCDVYTDFAPRNLGCARREVTAFDWVFRHCTEAILLEDDTLPSVSFFRFCETLLQHYRDDSRVMHICGNNFQASRSRQPLHSYYFSKYTHVWGWATWRRAWEKYDFHMRRWPEFKAAGHLATMCPDPHERAFWEEYLDRAYRDVVRFNSYDAQWLFACWSNGGLSIIPGVNLVTNIGFGQDATHTTHESPMAGVPATELDGELAHPPFFVRDEEADLWTYDHMLGGRYQRRPTVVRWLARKTWPIRRRLRARLQPR